MGSERRQKQIEHEYSLLQKHVQKLLEGHPLPATAADLLDATMKVIRGIGGSDKHTQNGNLHVIGELGDISWNDKDVAVTLPCWWIDYADCTEATEGRHVYYFDVDRK